MMARDPAIELPWRVTDLKQYVYCPRILYYHSCLPRVRPTTYKMEASAQAHLEAEHREKRRTLKAYGLDHGERHFNVPLVSQKFGLRGEVDMVIQTQQELIPVDYKLSSKPGRHFQLQLTAYALMLEESWCIPVKRGFLYLVPVRQAREVPVTKRQRTTLTEALSVMNASLYHEQMPPPTRHRAKCVACEFRRFCNDIM